MKEQSKKVVKEVVKLQENLSTLTVDEVNAKAPVYEPEPQKESLKERAKREGARYIEPTRRLSPPLGKLPEKLKADHARDWEYVKGIYENIVVAGEPLKFSYCKYAGDADYLWEIPANTPVYVPRFIAKHLENCQAYHTFDYVEKPQQFKTVDEYTDQFTVTGTQYRGKFRSMGAFE